MQLEFYLKNKPLEAHRFYSFVDICRENMIHGEKNFHSLHQDMIEYCIPALFEDFFIKKLVREIQFCISLRADFNFCQDHFKLHFPHLLSALDEHILENNIIFLGERAKFFTTAKFEDKVRVIEELLMNMVAQQGFLIMKQQETSQESQKTVVSRHPFSLYSPKRHTYAISDDCVTVSLKYKS